jgi:hypothetical protein
MTTANTMAYYDTATITSVKVLLYRPHLCGIQLKHGLFLVVRHFVFRHLI